MAYDYKPSAIRTYDYQAQAEVWRQKYLNERRNAAYWHARSLRAEASMVQASGASLTALRACEGGGAE